jgi:hypothetical protein
MLKILCSAFLLTVAACAPAGSDDMMTTADEVEEISGKADGVALPIGTYRTQKLELGEIRQVTIGADRSFSRWIQVVDCIPLKGCGPETGTVRFTRSIKTGARYIRFLDGDGDLMDRYQYTLAGADLTLRRDDVTTWTPFTAQ